MKWGKRRYANHKLMKQNTLNKGDRMVHIILPDGARREFTTAPTGMELATSLSKSLSKDAVLIRVNGALWDLSRPLPDGARVEIIVRNSKEGLEVIRHDCAHVLAQAVQELWPETQVTIGPVIETGFYYDFDRKEPFTLEDLQRIEARMHAIIAQNAAISREEWSRPAAMESFAAKGEMYKVEIIRDLPENEPITIYRQGEWFDLCRGPHAPNVGRIGRAFKLLKLAGAYWRGDHRNKMLQRIYGTAFLQEADLEAYLHQIEEAEKRDHRRIGREMDLFHFQEEAAGSVFWHPKGWTVYRLLEEYIRARIQQDGYVEVRTPQLVDRLLWEQSGHWEKFRQNMFTVPLYSETLEGGETTKEDGPDKAHNKPGKEAHKDSKILALKPMNCPCHVQIFNQGLKSYRDLPLRMAEFGCCHRNEAHGALHGLMRVRQMTQDDAHIFCTPEQITSESLKFCSLLTTVYRDLGFEKVTIKLATRPEIRAGSDEVWDKAEQGLADAVRAAAMEFELAPGDGAFYGPKLEFHLTDAIGRSWQCGTLQLDFVLPERLEASYIGEDGARHRPVMLHRAILGSMERFIGILIENYAGKLPLWLAPIQVSVASIVSEADPYVEEVADLLRGAGLRVITDKRNEKINYKVREHSLQKIPFILALGKREVAERSVALRRLGQDGQETLALDAAIPKLVDEARSPLAR
jgi:threonyl-tRNA synthetase